MPEITYTAYPKKRYSKNIGWLTILSLLVFAITGGMIASEQENTFNVRAIFLFSFLIAAILVISHLIWFMYAGTTYWIDDKKIRYRWLFKSGTLTKIIDFINGIGSSMNIHNSSTIPWTAVKSAVYVPEENGVLLQLERLWNKEKQIIYLPEKGGEEMRKKIIELAEKPRKQVG